MDKLTCIEIGIRNTKYRIAELQSYLEKLETMRTVALLELEADEVLENEPM